MKLQKKDNCSDHNCLDGKHLVLDELICHFPYAVFSVAFSVIALTILSFVLMANNTTNDAWFHMFHSFHFVHIVFAAAGSIMTFAKFSKNWVKGLVVGAISSSVFCILSDVLMPYIGATMLGINMKLHICFHHELHNILPFLLVGLLTGVMISWHNKGSHESTGLWSHFTHIFISSLASTFYLVSSGFSGWIDHIGELFLLLIFAVVIPCTLSDVVVPILFAKSDGKK